MRMPNHHKNDRMMENHLWGIIKSVQRCQREIIIKLRFFFNWKFLFIRAICEYLFEESKLAEITDKLGITDLIKTEAS